MGSSNTDRRQRLKKAYLDLFALALSRMRKQLFVLGDRIAQRHYAEPRETSISESETHFSANVSSQHMVTPDWIFFAIRMGETLIDTPECREAMAALGEFFDTTKYVGIERVHFFEPLADLVDAHAGLDIPEVALNTKIDEIINATETHLYQLEVTSVLSGFHADEDRIVFGESHILKPDDDEVRRHWKEAGDLSLQGNAITSADFLMRTEGPARDDAGGTEFHAFHTKLNRVLFALRLFKRGHVILSPPSSRKLSWAPIVAGGQRLRRSFAIRRYRVSKSEVPELVACWQRHAWLMDSKDPRIRLAVERLGFTYERERSHDAIIDTFIGLEALLSEDSKELSYKLRLRTANLIGKDADERRAIFEDIKAGYAVRSLIVHGNSKSKGFQLPSLGMEVDLNRFAEEMVRYLAKALVAISDFTAWHPDSDWIKHLDAVALGGN